jgi:uncharacterized protein (DUF58 family)
MNQPQKPLAGFDAKLLARLEGLAFKTRYLMEGYLNGQHKSPFHGFSVEFSDYRRYQPGDDLRHLDWRLYARSDRLCVKRYMQETNVRFYIVCDTSASMDYRGAEAWGSKLECAKVIGGALTWLLLKQNDAAGMVTVSGPESKPEFVRPSQKPSQLGLMLRQLDGLCPTGKTCLSALLANAARLVQRRSVILFLSDLLEPSAEVATGFRHLRFLGHEVIVLQILDRDEIEFPFTDGRIFEDLETGDRRQVSSITSARERYLEQFGNFMESYRKLFQELEIPISMVRTDQDPASALSRFLNDRRRFF